MFSLAASSCAFISVLPQRNRSAHVKTIKLKKKEERRILRGHPWIFSNELEKVSADVLPGEIVDVISSSGSFVGRGYLNPHTLIAVRMLTRRQEEIDRNFIQGRISTARELRFRLGMGDEDSYRAFFSEGDGLPGLIVDKYSETLVVQSLTAGIDRIQEDILSVLREVYRPQTIVLRNDAPAREIEGLGREKRVVMGTLPKTVTIEESGIHYNVDILDGQKTGFFFDQRENRLALRGLVSGRRTLDCFCYSGAWALSAARFGASETIGIDSSLRAVSLATENAALNSFNSLFYRGDVFEELRKLAKQKDAFGCIILDPPAFVKGRSKVREGLKGYREINSRALKILERGGVLVSCSCSHHIGPDLFREMLINSAYTAGRSVKLLEMRSQSRDHPALLAANETQYLKCAILMVN